MLAGESAAFTPQRCFPPTLRLPAFGSPALQALREDLARKIAEASSREAKQTTAASASADLKLTTNQAVTYTSSGSARTDLFFKLKGSDPLAGSSSVQFKKMLQQVNLLQLP